MSNYDERLKFWNEIQDNPRKLKVGHRAGLVAASAGKPDSMDRSSLESFQKELEEGVAALASITDPNVTPDANEKAVPLQARLREVQFELEKRPADEKRVDTGQPNPPPMPPAEAVVDAVASAVVAEQAIVDQGNLVDATETTSPTRVGPGVMRIRRRR